MRLSLWGSIIEFLPETPFCPHLLTFLIRLTLLNKFPSTFFETMNALEALNLSYNLDLTMLPEEIGELVNLLSKSVKYRPWKVASSDRAYEETEDPTIRWHEFS